ncbi:MAG: 50S ribosomal protein L25 [Planctomycetes bacterium HGW-Planctomycetes-1]|nr:MAG: 50S ribosomal protein L25 [Planctomycetes bacterium HGW-Planctomycetes-1]
MVSKELVLKAEIRKENGKKHSARLRLQGKIPAVVYGHKQEPQSIVLDLHDFTEGLHHGHKLFDIEIGSNKEKLLVKEVQYDHLGKKIIHADLIRVDLSEKVEVSVPLVFKGTPAGASEGGILEEHLDSIEIECAVTEIPESIDVSVKGLKIDESLHVRDIALPAGVKLVTDPELLVIACSKPIEVAPVEEAAGAEEPTSPEVITERKPKEGEEEESEKKE